MDLEYLKKAARTFAYQLRKFFPEEETPINHYICQNHVVVLSTKRLFIYFYDNYIDYVGDYFSRIEVINIDLDNKIFKVKINSRIFELIFEDEKDCFSFVKYYNKYSK